MNQLVKIVKDNIFTDSLVIAQGTGNQHKNVKELIQKYQKDIRDFGTLSVLNGESTGGRLSKVFQLNEEQATFVITLLRNSKQVVAFKKELVRQFYIMRQLLIEKQSQQWQQTRLESKKNRRLEAEEIKQLVQYAKAQGSENAEKYYITLSKLANKTVGISSTERERANINQLNTLILVENIINHRIQEGIKQGLHYKEIYRSCKERLKQFKEIAYLTEIKAIQEGK